MQKRSSLVPIFLSYAFICILFLFLSFGSRLSFLYGLSEILLHPLQASSYAVLTSYHGGESQDTLKKENTQLRLQLAKLNEMKKEDAALRDQYQTTTVPANKLVPAAILSARTFIPGVSIADTLVIDKGSSDQIKKGAAVVYKDMLLGLVTSVTPHASVVTLVTSNSSSLTAATTKTNAVGIVKGQGRGIMTYELVLLADSLESGDMVVTKGNTDDAGHGLPPGLVIGKLASVHKRASNLFQNAELQTVVDITKLTTVFVLQP